MLDSSRDSDKSTLLYLADNVLSEDVQIKNSIVYFIEDIIKEKPSSNLAPVLERYISSDISSLLKIKPPMLAKDHLSLDDLIENSDSYVTVEILDPEEDLNLKNKVVTNFLVYDPKSKESTFGKVYLNLEKLLEYINSDISYMSLLRFEASEIAAAALINSIYNGLNTILKNKTKLKPRILSHIEYYSNRDFYEQIGIPFLAVSLLRLSDRENKKVIFTVSRIYQNYAKGLSIFLSANNIISEDAIRTLEKYVSILSSGILPDQFLSNRVLKRYFTVEIPNPNVILYAHEFSVEILSRFSEIFSRDSTKMLKSYLHLARKLNRYLNINSFKKEQEEAIYI